MTTVLKNCKLSDMPIISEILGIDYDKTTLQERIVMRQAYLIDPNRDPDKVVWEYVEYLPGLDLKSGGVQKPPFYTKRLIVNLAGEVGRERGPNFVYYKGALSGGYLKVCLKENGVNVVMAINRIMATTFHHKLPEHIQEVTISTDRHNNTFNNIQWMTSEEARNHALKTGKMATGIDNVKARAIRCHCFNAPWEGHTFVICGKLAIQNAGLDPTTIYLAANGKINQAYGCIWEWVERDEVTSLDLAPPQELLTFIAKSKGVGISNLTYEGTVVGDCEYKGLTFIMDQPGWMSTMGVDQGHLSRAVRSGNTHANCKWRKVQKPLTGTVRLSHEQMRKINPR